MATSKRILMAEDCERDAELTLAALDTHHLAGEVAMVRDGKEALDYLFHRGAFQSGDWHSPAVVILDIKMPRVDGMEVLRQMKADERLQKVPVVMLTSSREEQDVARCYRLGVNAYVVKPVDFERFLVAIRQLVTFWAIINTTPAT